MIHLLPMLAAFIPVINYGATTLIDKLAGTSKAKDLLEAKRMDVEQLKAIAELENASGASQWVINIRALMRPFAVAVILMVWSGYVYKYGLSASDMMSLAEAAVFYLFGDRTQMALLGKK